MKDFWEKFKDFIHNFIDYILIIGIIGLVIVIIAWRLNNLFDTDLNDDNNLALEESLEDEDFDNKSIDEDLNLDKDSDSKEKTSDQDKEDKEKDDNKVKITIPSGSVSYEVGQILKDEGFVDKAMDFVDKAVELKLETQIRAGEYTIEKDASLEDVINIITQP